MKDELINSVAHNVCGIILTESVNMLKDETYGSQEKDVPSHECAVDEIVEQITEHVVVEMTKSLIKRSQRLKPEEPVGKAVETVKKMAVEVHSHVNNCVNAKSNTELSKGIKDALLVLQDAEAFLRAKNSKNSLACISQARLGLSSLGSN